MRIRPAVKRFAQDMERILRKHDTRKGKKGWEKDDCSLEFLTQKFNEEVKEYASCIPLFRIWKIDEKVKENVKKELIDVANICMMICEKLK